MRHCSLVTFVPVLTELGSKHITCFSVLACHSVAFFLHDLPEIYRAPEFTKGDFFLVLTSDYLEGTSYYLLYIRKKISPFRTSGAP